MSDSQCWDRPPVNPGDCQRGWRGLLLAGGLVWGSQLIQWFVARKESGVGDLAAKQLLMRGYESYEPRVFLVDGEDKDEFLYPRYIFVRCSGTRRDFVRINATRGVDRLLPDHLLDPLPLPDGYVEYLREYVQQHNATREQVEEISVAFVRDQILTVTCGSHSGKSGPFQYKKKGCVVILLALLGAKREVMIPTQNVSVGSDRTTTRWSRNSFAPQFKRRKPQESLQPLASLPPNSEGSIVAAA